MASETLRVGVCSSSAPWREALAAELSMADRIDARPLDEQAALLSDLDALVVDAIDDIAVDALLVHDEAVVPLVLLIEAPEREAAARWTSGGSVALLEREPSIASIEAALHAVVGGLTCFASAYASTLLDPIDRPDRPRSHEWIEPLTPRELQILRMLSEGLANKAIAAQLKISEHTAKFHVGQILAKLNAESRTEAVTVGVRAGLVLL